LLTVGSIKSGHVHLGAMSHEETYYWFTETFGEHAERATHTFRILLGAETI